MIKTAAYRASKEKNDCKLGLFKTMDINFFGGGIEEATRMRERVEKHNNGVAVL